MARRPGNIVTPRPGQESVWDYPRPPVVQTDHRLVTVTFTGIEIVRSSRTIRVLETSHPPAFYIPPQDLYMAHLEPTEHSSFCEFKGQAVYFNLQVGDRISRNAAWCYPDPGADYGSIAGYLSFYPSRVDECTVDNQAVTPQAGDFYGGWITPEIVGPFKGAPGTDWW